MNDTQRVSRVGEKLEGRYELVRWLGGGGMGEVYEGRHATLQRRVAIKFLLPHVATHGALLARFEAEARIAGSIEHENVAAVYDIGQSLDGSPYLVMEFLEGEDWGALLRREGPLSLPHAARLLVQVCRGLERVHERGVVHRDLKPANLFLCRRADGSDVAKILDFGIAKLRDGEKRAAMPTTGPAMGTPHYMSPEQARGDRRIDHTTDIYSLGVIFYELLSNAKPFDGDSALQVIHHILTREATPLERRRGDLPAGVHALVQQAMAREASERFASVTELGAALAVYADPPRAGPETTRREARARPAPRVGNRRRETTLSAMSPTTNVPVSPEVRSVPTARRARFGVWIATGVAVGLVAAALRLAYREEVVPPMSGSPLDKDRSSPLLEGGTSTLVDSFEPVSGQREKRPDSSEPLPQVHPILVEPTPPTANDIGSPQTPAPKSIDGRRRRSHPGSLDSIIEQTSRRELEAEIELKTAPAKAPAPAVTALPADPSPAPTPPPATPKPPPGRLEIDHDSPYR
jgi:serine/threonine protein kinase